MGIPHVQDQGRSPVAENGFRACQRAKLSSKDTQMYTISCIFLPKIKLNLLKKKTKNWFSRLIIA